MISPSTFQRRITQSLRPLASSTVQDLCLDEVVSHFGHSLRQVSLIDYTHYNSIGYKVETSAGTFMLKRLTGEDIPGWRYRENPQFLEQLAETAQFLKAQGVATSVPLQVPNTPRAGAIVRGCLWTMSDWIDVESYYTGFLAQTQALGQSLARMHTALKKFQNQTPQPALVQRCSDPMLASAYNYLPTQRGVRELIEKAAATFATQDSTMQPYQKILRDEKDNLLRAATLVEGELSAGWSQPPQLVHGNISPENLLVSKKQVYIIDFEKVFFGAPMYDVGAALGIILKAPKTYRLAGLHRIEEALVQSYFEVAGVVRPSAQTLRAYAVLHDLHLALLNIDNLFLRKKTGGIKTFEPLVTNVGRTLEMCEAL